MLLSLLHLKVEVNSVQLQVPVEEVLEHLEMGRMSPRQRGIQVVHPDFVHDALRHRQQPALLIWLQVSESSLGHCRANCIRRVVLMLGSC